MVGYPPVEILEKGFVVPGQETPSEDIWLSNLDLLVARAHTPTVYFYRRPVGFLSPEAAVSVAELKVSLSRALVPFYPLAGRFASAPDGRLCIRCSAEGALFVVARSDSTLEDFGDFAPSDQIRRLLVHSVDGVNLADSPLLLLQVTFLKDGNLCVGVAIHHTAADGLGALHFVNSWAKMNRTQNYTPIPPSLNRAILRARSPPSITRTHTEYTQSPCTASRLPFISSILRLSNRQISLLKTANPESPLSTFKALAAHTWRTFCRTCELDPTRPTRLYLTADARSRLNPPLLAEYLGNAIFRVAAEAKVGDVVAFGAPEKIGAALRRIDEEFVRSLVDYLGERVDDAGVRKGGWAMADADLWVISWIGLPIYDADFGWGKPFYMGRACLQFPGLFYFVPEEDRGGVAVVAAMEEERMERFTDLFYEDIGRVGPGEN